MSDSPIPSALASRQVDTGQKGVVLAFAWTSACFATALAIYGLAGLIAAENEREVDRLAGDMLGGKSYVAVLVGAYATRHGRIVP